MSLVIGAQATALQSGLAARGVFFPKGSLDIWRAARNNAANQLVEVVIFGDSTTYGSCFDALMYSWTQDLRAASIAAGYPDAGRGIVYDDVNGGDVAANNGDITTIVSRSSWALGLGNNTGFTVTPGPIANNVAGGTLTVQGVGTQIRLHVSKIANTTGKLTYSVDGGAAVTVDCTSAGFTADTLLIASGLTAGTHTVTLTCLGYGSAVPVTLFPTNPVVASTASGTLAAGTYRYAVTRSPNAGSGENLPTISSSVTLSGTGNITVTANNDVTGGIYKFYRQTGGTGSYLFLGSVTKATSGGQAVFVDDGSFTPGAAAPSTDTSQDTSVPWVEVNLDFINATGIVYHKQATSGISSGSYFGIGQPALGNYPAQIALGLTPGTATAPVTAAFGWASPQATPKPRYRNPSLAVCALGINDMQGQSPPGTNSGTTDVDNANRAALGYQNNLHNFVRMTRQAGADPVIVIPHYTIANNNHYYAGMMTAAAYAVAAADSCALVDFNYLIGQPKDWAGNGVAAAVHSSKAAYRLEGTGLWNLLLSL